MLPQSSWKRLSQGTAIITLGLAMLAVSGTDKASAANLQVFKISGTFDQEFISESSFYRPNLTNGYFDGTYTVDVNKLPTTTRVNLKDWSINLYNSEGTPETSFEPLLFPYNTSGFVAQQESSIGSSISPSSGSELSFTYGPSPSSSRDLRLFVNSDFTGISVGRPETIVYIGNGFVTVPPYYGIYEQPYSGIGILVTSFKSELVGPPVPEPFTLGGTVVAGAIGWWLKRKQQKTQNTPV